MTTKEKLKLIDEFLEEPNSNDPRWIEMMKDYRQRLIDAERARENSYIAAFERNAFRGGKGKK